VANPDGIQAETETLLQQAQTGSDSVQNFSWDYLQQFRRERAITLEPQRQDGRGLALRGEDRPSGLKMTPKQLPHLPERPCCSLIPSSALGRFQQSL
jgi:hypothetical protein